MLSIVTVSWNGLELTKKCVESIRKHTKDYELIVVDNGSTDGTVEYLKAQKDIKVILNKDNAGWIKGVNQGFKVMKGEYMCMMNNDIEVTPFWWEKLEAHFHKGVGAVAPTAKNTSGVHSPKFNQGRPEHDEVNWLVGFCIVIERNVYENIGGLDECFGWGHSDDVDYCYRMSQMGYKRVVGRDCFVHHHGSKSIANRFTQEEYQQDLAKKTKTLYEKWGQKEMEQFSSIMEPTAGTVGILHLDNVVASFAHSLQRLQLPSQTKISFCQGLSGIAKVRSDIAKDVEGNWLLFLDSDMEYPPDTLNRLLAHDVDVVGGMCYRKVPPYNPTIYKKQRYSEDMCYMSTWPENQLIEVDATGAACLLIKREVLEALPDPIFEDSKVSEDMTFCKKARAAGFKVYVDTSLHIGHVGQEKVYGNHFQQYNADVLKHINNTSIIKI